MIDAFGVERGEVEKLFNPIKMLRGASKVKPPKGPSAAPGNTSAARMQASRGMPKPPPRAQSNTPTTAPRMSTPASSPNVGPVGTNTVTIPGPKAPKAKKGGGKDKSNGGKGQAPSWQDRAKKFATTNSWQRNTAAGGGVVGVGAVGYGATRSRNG